MSTSLSELTMQIENITGRLEKGDLPLEEALEIFEEGVALSRAAQKILESAEQKVKLLMEKDENPQGFPD